MTTGHHEIDAINSFEVLGLDEEVSKRLGLCFAMGGIQVRRDVAEGVPLVISWPDASRPVALELGISFKHRLLVCNDRGVVHYLETSALEQVDRVDWLEDVCARTAMTGTMVWEFPRQSMLLSDETKTVAKLDPFMELETLVPEAERLAQIACADALLRAGCDRYADDKLLAALAAPLRLRMRDALYSALTNAIPHYEEARGVARRALRLSELNWVSTAAAACHRNRLQALDPANVPAVLVSSMAWSAEDEPPFDELRAAASLTETIDWSGKFYKALATELGTGEAEARALRELPVSAFPGGASAHSISSIRQIAEALTCLRGNMPTRSTFPRFESVLFDVIGRIEQEARIKFNERRMESWLHEFAGGAHFSGKRSPKLLERYLSGDALEVINEFVEAANHAIASLLQAQPGQLQGACGRIEDGSRINVYLPALLHSPTALLRMADRYQAMLRAQRSRPRMAAGQPFTDWHWAPLAKDGTTEWQVTPDRRIVNLVSASALCKEGIDLAHCAGSLVGNAAGRWSYLFSCRGESGTAMSTFELRPVFPPGLGSVSLLLVEHRGLRNSPPSTECRVAVKAFRGMLDRIAPPDYLWQSVALDGARVAEDASRRLGFFIAEVAAIGRASALQPSNQRGIEAPSTAALSAPATNRTLPNG